MGAHGTWAPVLHAHLPFVRHPESARYLEEEWFFEALAESYWPLVDALERLRRDGVPYALTLSISPTLGAMLADTLLAARYRTYLEERLRALVGERRRLPHAAAAVVDLYVARYEWLLGRCVDGGAGAVLRAFARLAEAGGLEIITTAATHAYLPVLGAFGIDVRPQIALGRRWHAAQFGSRAAGMWLPECGYFPALAGELVAQGVGYVVVERHGLLHGRPRPQSGVHRPVRTPEGLAVLARDYESAQQVWSSIDGYPGDACYRDFYRDAGFDSDAPHLLPLRHSVEPSFTGLKYHAVGDAREDKPLYDPERARARVRAHAHDFVARRRAQVQWLGGVMDEAPVLVTPYDAELFGHWWFEGPWWIEEVFRELARSGDELRALTVSAAVAQCPAMQQLEVAESSWGEGGYHRVWLNPATDWIYPRLARAASAMANAARAPIAASGLVERALVQAGRELLLAQSSDWPFMLTRNSASDYARRRVVEHLDNTERLLGEVARGSVDASALRLLEERHNLFADLRVDDFAGSGVAP